MAIPKKSQLDLFQFDWAMAEFRLRKMLEISNVSVKSTYHPDEVARILGIHKSTVYRLIDSTSLNAIQLDTGFHINRKRVDFGSLVQYIGENSREE